MSKIVKALINLEAVAVAVDTTDVCETARRLHGLSPTATAALGRTLTGAVILGNALKSEQDSVTLSISGGGPVGVLTAVANGKCEVKGYAAHPLADAPLNDKGKLNVSGIVGNDGFLTVIKDLGLKKPYIGKVKLVSGEIAEDMASYFALSEQSPCVVFLSVIVDTDRTVKRAGGVAVFLLPGASEEMTAAIEQRVDQIGGFVKALDTVSLEEGLKRIFNGMDVDIIVEEQFPKFVCGCTKEGTERVIISLGEKEISDIIEQDGKAEVVCRFCGKKYYFNADDLKRLLVCAREH